MSKKRKAIPWRMKEMVLVRYGIVVCYLCAERIRASQDIEYDHIQALVHGGEHDWKNLAPVHIECHKAKTIRDIKANAKAKRLQNPKPSKHPMKSRPIKWPKRKFPKRQQAWSPK